VDTLYILYNISFTADSIHIFRSRYVMHCISINLMAYLSFMRKICAIVYVCAIPWVRFPPFM